MHGQSGARCILPEHGGRPLRPVHGEHKWRQRSQRRTRVGSSARLRIHERHRRSSFSETAPARYFRRDRRGADCRRQRQRQLHRDAIQPILRVVADVGGRVWRENRESVTANSAVPTGTDAGDIDQLTYMRWNMGSTRFASFLFLRDMSGNADPSGAVPPLPTWAFHREVRQEEWDSPEPMRSASTTPVRRTASSTRGGDAR